MDGLNLIITGVHASRSGRADSTAMSRARNEYHIASIVRWMCAYALIHTAQTRGSATRLQSLRGRHFLVFRTLAIDKTRLSVLLSHHPGVADYSAFSRLMFTDTRRLDHHAQFASATII